ncbi:MAG: peptidoglycan editing factor PgeF [Thermodesulfovibrio sp.]|nr:peptidoglycan editing factor PgeF [Thermodesulfovibrio sp.]
MHILYPENLKDYNILALFTGKNFNLDYLTSPLYFPIQRHTDNVLVLKDYIDRKIADAVITDKRNILIGVKVADCVPILIFDPSAKVVAAVHAGWRGTAKGILKRTIIKMKETFNSNPAHLLIAMGPSIKGCCYEVGQDVIEALKTQTPSEEFILSFDGKKHVDLSIANLLQALSLNIPKENIWICPDCTYCKSNLYASYRHKKKFAGRQYGIIGML